jgi:hypothetical protein
MIANWANENYLNISLAISSSCYVVINFLYQDTCTVQSAQCTVRSAQCTVSKVTMSTVIIQNSHYITTACCETGKGYKMRNSSFNCTVYVNPLTFLWLFNHMKSSFLTVMTYTYIESIIKKKIYKKKYLS